MNVIKNLKKSFIRVLGLLFICSFALAIGFAFVNGNVTEAKADESTVVEYAVLKADNSWLKSNKRIAFQIDKNNRPADSNYDINGGSITLERDGKSYKRTDGMTLTVYTNGEDCVAYMELWAFGNELGETYTRNVGDVYTIEGQFGNIKIKESKIVVAGGDTLCLYEQLKNGVFENNGTENVSAKTASNFQWRAATRYIFDTQNSGNPFAGGSIKPLYAENILLIRNGVTFVIGNTVANCFDYTEWGYLAGGTETAIWWMPDVAGDKKPLDGDIVIIRGAFTDGTTVRNFEELKIKVVSDGTNFNQYVVHNCKFIDIDGVEHYYEYTVADRATVLEKLKALLHTSDGANSYSNDLPAELPEKNGITYSEKKISIPVYNASASDSAADWDAGYMAYYFNLDDNGAIGNWTADYKPLKEDAVKVTRGETVYNVANTNFDIINKRENTYILKTWAFGAARPLQTGDVITIDGTFSNGTTTFTIAKVEFVLSDNGSGVTKYSQDDGLEHYMKIKTEEKMTMLTGASVRAVNDGYNGIRFEAEVGKEIDENAKYYVMIVPYSYMDGITGDYYAELSAKYSTLAVMESTPYLNEVDDGTRKANTYYVRGSLVNLKYNNLNRKFFGIAYKELNGVRTYAEFVEGENVRSVAQVSSRALNAAASKGESLSDGMKTALETFVNKAVYQANGKTETEADNAAKVEFTLDRTTLNLAPGESYTLKCANLPDNADIEILNATDNGNIATINGLTVTAGNVTGETYVKAYIAGQYRYVPVNVQTTQAKIGVWAGSVWDIENESYLLTDERMTELADAGVNMILGVWHNPDETNWTYRLFAESLDRADELGIKIYPKYEGDGLTVPSYWNHNAIGGFLVWDEPGIGKFAEIKTICASLEEKTNKPCFANLMPGACSNEAIGISDATQKNAYLNDAYEKEYVEGYINNVGGSIISYDYYAIKTDSDGNNRNITWSYLRDFDIYSYNAKQNNKELWYTMLSAGHNSVDNTKFVVPDENDLRWQSALAMTFGAKRLNHYVYTSDAADYTAMLDYKTGEKSSVFYAMATVNREIQSWSGTYASYEWQGVSTVGDNILFKNKEQPGKFFNSKVELIKHKIALNGCSMIAAEGSAVVGNFKNSNGKYAYMITNAEDPSNGVTTKITITFSDSCSQVKVIRRGIETTVEVGGNSLTLEIGAGEGVFVMPQ